MSADHLREPARPRPADGPAGALCALAAALAAALLLVGATPALGNEPNLQATPNDSGVARTFSTSGAIDTQNPFFQSLGSNGRACATCHQASDGWTISPPHVQARFDATGGLEPLFRPNDGSTSPTADVSSVAARRAAYALLLSKGLIRIGIGLPPGAEFSLEAVDDPYGYASARELSLFRRPLPATNLRFLSSVMWDGREAAPGQSIQSDLISQARDAVLGHAQGASPPTADQLQQIVAFDTALFTAQASDSAAGDLEAQGGLGGPVQLSSQAAPSAGAPPGFALYAAWAGLPSADPYTAARQAVARGEALFNRRTFTISGVAGLNDALGQPAIVGTCTTCHSTPNAGSRSVPELLNVGNSDAARRTPDLPLYTLRNSVTGATIQTTDPGRALITGRWADIGKLKVPTLRALESRSPYFHNSSADSLEAVLGFYNARFGIRLTPGEQADLAAFLRAL